MWKHVSFSFFQQQTVRTVNLYFRMVLVTVWNLGPKRHELQLLENLFFITNYYISRHLIGFFLFLALTIYTAMKVPEVVDLHALPDVLKNADLHKLHEELLMCLPSLPNMPDLHKLREELKTSLPSMDLLPSLSGWHVMELLNNCLPQRFSHGNHTDVCVLVMLYL